MMPDFNLDTEFFEDSGNKSTLELEKAEFEEFFPDYSANPVNRTDNFVEIDHSVQSEQVAVNLPNNHADGISMYCEAPITDQLQHGTRGGHQETQSSVQHVDISNSVFSMNEFVDFPAQFNNCAQYSHDGSLPTVPQEPQQPPTKKQDCHPPLHYFGHMNSASPVNGTSNSFGSPAVHFNWNGEYSHDGSPPTGVTDSANQQILTSGNFPIIPQESHNQQPSTIQPAYQSPLQYIDQTILAIPADGILDSNVLSAAQFNWNSHNGNPPTGLQASGTQQSTTRKRPLDELTSKQQYQHLNGSYQKLFQEYNNLKQLLNGSPVGKLLEANEKADFYKRKYQESERRRAEEKAEFAKAIQEGVGTVGNVDERSWYKAVFACEKQMSRTSGMSFFPECFFSADRLPRMLPQEVENIPQDVDVKYTLLNGKESDCKQWRKLIQILRTQQTKQINDGYIVLKGAAQTD